LRISGGLRGLRKELVDRVPRLRVPFKTTKTFAGTLEAVTDTNEDVFVTSADSQNALHLVRLSAHGDDLGQLADEFGCVAPGNEFFVADQSSEKVVAGAGGGTQNGRANPNVCGITHRNGGESIDRTRVRNLAEREGELETDASVGVRGEFEKFSEKLFA
jgi:hypothetical protein